MNIRGGFMRRLQREEAEFSLSDLGSGSLRIIARYVRPYLGRVLLAALLMLVATAASLAMPLLAKIAVDRYIVPGDLSGLTVVALAYLGLAVVFWPASFGQGYLSGWVSQRVVHDLRRDMVANLLRQSLEFHRRERVGQMMSRVTNDVSNVADFVSTSLINLVNDVLTVSAIVVVMAILNLRLTLVTMLSVPVVILGLSLLARRMRRAYLHVQQEIAAVNTGVEQGVTGMRVTKSLARESFNVEQFEMLSLRNMRANLHTAVLFAALFPVMTVSNMLSVALVIGYGGTLVAAGTMTIGVIFAFLGYVIRFFGPLRELSLVYNALQAAAASLARIGEYLRLEPEISQPRKTRNRPPQGFRGRVDFRGVSFAYSEEPVLRDVTLSVEPSRTLALVGPTGAGKSTLGLLLARLYVPGEGRIEIDGVGLEDIGAAELRRLVTVVPQEAYLFPGTIMENIRYGDPEADEEAVKRAARLVRAHNFIEDLPRGYESRTGEAGGRLSGGQKQLIALARALLKDPLIMVLDETTAHVDALTESRLHEGMDELSRNRTTIVIAHRFSTLRRADSIAVLDEGRIVARGSHGDLMRDSAAYRRLYRKQWASSRSRETSDGEA
ncbi:MAG: ABC transporter ATP-binding protein [Candidatus Fermentibacteraceae bacterium]